MFVAELFFGRSIRGRAPVSDSEWSGFVSQTITKEFPDGFTVEDGEGGWADPATHALAREQTKILIVALPESRDAGRKIDRVVRQYRRDFQQTSVGILTKTMCGAF